MGKKKDIYCINCGKFIESTRWPGLKYHVCEECKRERHGGSVSESVSESEGRSESGAGVGSQTRTYEYEREVSPESFRDRWPMLSIGLLFLVVGF